MNMTEIERVLVTFCEDQIEMIRSLKGFGTEDAEAANEALKEKVLTLRVPKQKSEFPFFALSRV